MRIQLENLTAVLTLTGATLTDDGDVFQAVRIEIEEGEELRHTAVLYARPFSTSHLAALNDVSDLVGEHVTRDDVAEIKRAVGKVLRGA